MSEKKAEPAVILELERLLREGEGLLEEGIRLDVPWVGLQRAQCDFLRDVIERYRPESMS